MSVLLSLLACSASGPSLSVEEPWVRLMPPTAPNSGGFMKLSSSEDAAVVGAEAEISNTVELHTHREVAGVMRMRGVDRIELPAGETVALEPGGLHIMFIGLNVVLSEGQEVPITLLLEDGGEHALVATVRGD